MLKLSDRNVLKNKDYNFVYQNYWQWTLCIILQWM